MNKKICFLVLFLSILLTGCTSKKELDVISYDLFSEVASNYQFTVSDNMSNYQNYNYIINSMVATYNDIKLEMVTYDTLDNASKVQNDQIDNFNLLKSTGASEVKEKGKNYYKYILISNGYYMINIRVDNTLIFCKTQLANKDIVTNIINNFGY